MPQELNACLDTLENAIDLEWERVKLETWKRILDFEPQPEPFSASSAVGGSEAAEWPQIGINEAINDPEKMLLQQLRPVYQAACRHSYSALNIRCNYGTGILPTLFGAELFWMDDELDTLPTARPLEGADPMSRLLDAGPPDLNAGLGARVFETAEYFKDTLAPYPKTSEAVWLYHPDLQGPIDVVELLWGSAMYYAFYEEPDKVKAVTQLVTDAYVRYLSKWLELVPPRGDATLMAHWGFFFKGQVMLRDDSIVNLSPEMYAEFVKPYDDRILEKFGGGAIHFCGKADHCIDLMTSSRRLTAVNMSQPEMNDMRRIHQATAGRGVLLNCPYREETMHGLDLTKGVVLI